MSFSKLALAGLAGLLLAGPVLAQKAKPAPKAPPVAPAPAAGPAPAVGADDSRRSLRITPERPLAGQPLVLHYAPAGTPLAGKAGIRAVVYGFEVDKMRWVAYDLALQPSPNAGELTGSFTPPAGVGFVAYKFVAADGTADKHLDHGLLSGYFSMLDDPARPGLAAPGSYLGYGLARKPEAGYGIPGYFDKFSISNEALFLWVSQELRFHPEEGPALMPQFIAALRLSQPTAYLPRARHALALASRQPNPRETDWLGCYYGYASLPEGKAQADSLARQITQRYPAGYLVRLANYQEVSGLPDAARKLAGWQALLAAYPPSPEYLPPARYTIDYGKVYENIILLDMARKDYRAVATYAPLLRYTGLLNTYYKAVQVSIRPGIRTAAEALPDATLLIERLDQFRAQRPAEFSYLSPLEWQAYFDQTSNPWRIHYAGLLAELGQPARALAYAETAQRIAGFGNATLNDIQAGLLHAAGPASAAPLRQVLEASVHRNQASPRMLDWLRESYAAAHPGGTGYAQYLAGLQDADAQRKARAELATQLLDKPVTDFALRDLDGQLVRLSDQKGKTVVLDLWATWCVPCKASFPGMKLAQERFKNDPSVVFYFIDTEETEPDYKQQVRDYLAAKGFPFRVLFDQPAPGTKTLDGTYARICKDYHVSGIPQKLIIDPQGRLRFLTTGYKGSPTALADEIEAMVELARTAK